MKVPPPAGELKFLVLGHRGSRRRETENTIASLALALEEGAEGFETDLRRLSDGSIVLFHDAEVDGIRTERWTTDALRERIGPLALLSDLERFRGRARMILEVKTSGFEKELVETIRGWENVIVSSFDHALVGRLARRTRTFELGVINAGALVDPADYVAGLGAEWMFPQWELVDRDLVVKLHRRKLGVIPWTANGPGSWAELLEAGCDGVITDTPAEAVAWRRGQSGELLC
ncbi:MAG: glycerophosphodiester phosphodiesterase [Thermoanaerobaculia bacterium]